jgi:5-methylcytosine-specific restriction protein A
MPSKPKRPCPEPGCRELVTKGRCAAHIKTMRKAFDSRRGTAQQRGYGRPWRKARQAYLRRNPLCVLHLAAGRTEAATEVDHIIPHRGDMELFWDRDNWQALCKSCHDRKTGRGE